MDDEALREARTTTTRTRANLVTCLNHTSTGDSLRMVASSKSVFEDDLSYLSNVE